MREAAARVDYDYADDPPPRRQRPRHVEPTIAAAPRPPARSQPLAGGARGVFHAVLRRPMLSLAIFSGAALSIGFFANALFMQSGPHPAPLFASKDAPRPNPAPAPAPRQGQAAAPADAVNAGRAQSQTAQSSPVAAPRSAPPAVAPMPSGPVPSGAAPAAALPTAPPAPPQRGQPARAAEAEQKFDPITQFLRSGSAPPAAPLAPATTASTASASTSPDPGPRRVMAAQRALSKLGHKVEADGLSGPSTRAAIQAFEREARLPVTGELNPRTMRELASRSGLQIQ